MSKPHIRLHCRRQFDEIVWRAQIGPPTLGGWWFSSAYRALHEFRKPHAQLESIERLENQRDFVSGKPYIPKR